MAKLRNDQWETIFAAVENRGKTLEEEAIRLKITLDDLIACGDQKFTRSKRWEKCKRLSEKREKKQTPKNMAKLRNDQWGTIFAAVEYRGKTLEEEAIRLKITLDDLIACGDQKFTRSKRWEKCKRLSEKREKKQTPKKRKP